jgi:hypothetical protein
MAQFSHQNPAHKFFELSILHEIQPIQHKVEQLKIDPYAAIAIWSGKKFSDLYCRDPGTG